MRLWLKYSGVLLVSSLLTALPLFGQDITATITITPTAETSLADTPTAAQTLDNTATVVMAAPTETNIPTVTETAVPSSPTPETAVPSSPTDTQTPMPPALLLQTVSGYAYYQNSRHDQHGKIEIEIFTDPRQWIARSVTDADGSYQIVVPVEVPFWVVADAPLHRESAVRVLPGAALPVLVVLGGDLDDDDCVTLADLQRFGEQPIAADINHDGQISIADVAILTGNLQPECEIFARSLPTLASTPAPTTRPLLTPTGTMQSISPLPVTSVTATAVFTAIPVDLTLTAPPSAAATWAATMTVGVPTDLSPAAAPESTAESTPESAIESTAEINGG